MKNLFHSSIDEDYYKPIKTNNAFNMKVKKIRKKLYQLKNILIRSDHI